MNRRFFAGQFDISSAINETRLADVSDVWVLVNMDMTFYYRVNYDVSNWELLIAQLQTDHQVKQQDVGVEIHYSVLCADFNEPPALQPATVSYCRCSVTSRGHSSSQTYLRLVGKNTS